MNPQDPQITAAVDVARKNLKGSQELCPVFILGKGDERQLIGTPFGSDEQKDMVAMLIKIRAQEMGADFVLFVSEAYTIRDQEAAKEFMDNRDMYPSVSTHPKAVEVVMFMLETQTKSWSGIADIEPGRVLGELEWMLCKDAQGRFTNFLGDKPTIN
ncbi:MAG: hypothetical protein WC100_01345 [Sterolibacterium sp.]